MLLINIVLLFTVGSILGVVVETILFISFPGGWKTAGEWSQPLPRESLRHGFLGIFWAEVLPLEWADQYHLYVLLGHLGISLYQNDPSVAVRFIYCIYDIFLNPRNPVQDPISA